MITSERTERVRLIIINFIGNSGIIYTGKINKIQSTPKKLCKASKKK